TIMIVVCLVAISLVSEFFLGWLFFAGRVIPRIQVNWTLVSIGFASFLGIVLMIHLLGSWICGERSREETKTRWRFRASASCGLLIVVMFCAGLSAVGVSHQAAWLWRSRDTWYVEKLQLRRFEDEHRALQSGMYELSFGIQNYGATYKRLPFRDLSQPNSESWPSRILPFLASSKFGWDSEESWDHPNNRDQFSRVVPYLLNPTLENAPQHDADGYGLSHFEANSNVRSFSYDDLKEDRSSVIMIGEVNSRFEPWGKPNTDRRVDLGLNRHPEGFGGPSSRDSVMFLMTDGSVRAINDTVDERVLRQLSGEISED
ncbi:MAG: hypothetical protein AAF802_10725, partial [Planctomycetota bacterium]